MIVYLKGRRKAIRIIYSCDKKEKPINAYDFRLFFSLSLSICVPFHPPILKFKHVRKIDVKLGVRVCVFLLKFKKALSLFLLSFFLCLSFILSPLVYIVRSIKLRVCFRRFFLFVFLSAFASKKLHRHIFQ